MLINGATKVVGLFGDPVSHSFSPAMFNAAFRERGMNYCYLPFHVFREDIASAVKAVASLGLKGVNVTAPHKETVVPFLDRLSPEAVFLNAVNTIKNEQNKLAGYNTDVDGFLYLLHKNLGDVLPLEDALLLGAGGAARAVSLALAKAGVKSLTIANRTRNRAEGLASLLIQGGIFAEEKVIIIELAKEQLLEKIKSPTLIINALSNDPAELGFLPCFDFWKCKGAIDLRYSKPSYPFAKWAEDNGVPLICGLDMLLGQGIKAFEILTGEKAPRQIMQETLRQLTVDS